MCNYCVGDRLVKSRSNENDLVVDQLGGGLNASVTKAY